MTSPAIPARPPLDRIQAVLAFGRFCVLSGTLDLTVCGNRGAWRHAAGEVAQLLTGRRVHDVELLDQVEDVFVALCDVITDEAALEADRDGYLDRAGLPQTGPVYDAVKGRLLADRAHHLQRLEAITR